MIYIQEKKFVTIYDESIKICRLFFNYEIYLKIFL